jgi:hypothetical protein
MGMLKEGQSAGVEPDECYNITGKGDQAGIAKRVQRRKNSLVVIGIHRPLYQWPLTAVAFAFAATYSAPALRKGLKMASGSWKLLWTTLTRKQVSMSSVIRFWEGELAS